MQSSVPEAAANSAPRRKRRWWLAALLSLIDPGLGQLYNGRLLRAAVFLGVSVALNFLAVVLLAYAGRGFEKFATLFSVAVVYLVWRLVALIDAGLGARRAGTIVLARYQRWYIYAGIFVGLSAFDGLVLGEPDVSAAVFTIPTESMLPTLKPGDWIVAEKNYYVGRRPERGDLVVYWFCAPKRANTSDNSHRPACVEYVKRVVGLPGDRVQIRGGVLHINGSPATQDVEDDSDPRSGRRIVEILPSGRRYRILDLGYDPHSDETDVLVPPEGTFVFLGDNRDNSIDSRFPNDHGFIAAGTLLHRPAFVIWNARDWSRIGLRLE